MSKYALETLPVVALSVAGSDEHFPVHRVYCIEIDYAAHAIEMGHDPGREAPFIFQINADSPETSGEFPIQRNRPTCITRPSFSSCLNQAARTFPS